MTTRKMRVNEEPQRVTGGNETAVIQFNGTVALCDSAEKPATGAAAMYFSSDGRYQTLTITPPFRAWIWSAVPEKTVDVVISDWTESVS
ncbi:hypothetical protein ECIG_04499 [Escherichia coli M605]|uniref:Uncharacterized protein n=1 Tax=Escherichia coli M605 TaxID=656417 RepID=F4T775_ECOLX|nr:hypothetical protein [Escherichia coli]EGI13152.1 hypothetical protein ECIG_04499 [Escherichia coli M605]